MNGISIGRAHRGAVIRRNHDGVQSVTTYFSSQPSLELDQLTDFVEFFSPAYALLGSLYWLLDNVRIVPPESWTQGYDAELECDTGPKWDDFNAEVIASRDSRRLVRPGFLQKYAEYMLDDWCKILGFGEAPANPNSFIMLLSDRVKDACLFQRNPRVEVAFFCIDGVRWEMFSREEALLSVVRNHLAPRQDLVIRDMTLEESVA